MMHRRHVVTCLLISVSVLAYDAVPRWGQAVVLVNDAMFVFGGKTDVFNAYSYTSAPDTNDILYLSLSSSFNTIAPPWELVSSTENSTSQGPSLSWHTLSALNSTHALLFGGLPGPNAVTPIPEGSGLILSVLNRLQPVWLDKLTSWAGEPIRRMRHTAVTSMSGHIFIIGGERTDGSGLGFGDHVVFDPLTQMFSPLPPTANSPPPLFGHASIILPDGCLLVFGGYSQAQATLVPLSTIWALNTSSNPLAWSVATVDTGSLPSPRMGFAAAHIGGGRVLVHGGADANLQTNFDDGWILDTSRTPMTWTQRPGLSRIGARRDHFAVAYSNQVLFGFGYGNSGPAPAPLLLYDADEDNLSPSYTPPPVTSLPSPTLPPPSGSTHTMRPAPTTGGNSPSNTTNDTGGSGDDKKTGGGVAIIVGAIFGVLGALTVGAGLVYYLRRRQADRGHFVSLIGDDDDAGSDRFRSIPAVTMREGYERRTVLGSIGGVVGAAATRMRSIRNPNVLERRDMLADEDARSFGDWYRVQGTSDAAESSWSLRSILGGGTSAGHRLASREPSGGSRATASKTTPWAEKDDPFSDGARAIHDEETGFIGAAVVPRPSTRRETSHTSSVSAYSQTSYRDPFGDPIHEEKDDVAIMKWSYNQPSVRQVTSLPPVVTILPLSHQTGHTLSPVSERTSRTTLAADFNTIGSSHANSSENAAISPFDGGSLSQATSITSVEPGGLPGSPSAPSAASILASQPIQPLKRSDSWWSRFASGHLLDRRSSVKSQTQHDPRVIYPSLRLGAIEERSIVSSAPHSGDSGQDTVGLPSSGKASPTMDTPALYRPSHGQSLTSLRTADSETIERMAGTMDVIQRFKTQSHETTGSFSSAGSVNFGGRSSQLSSEQDISETGELICTSPLEMESPAHAPLSTAYFSSPERSAIPKSPIRGLPPVSPGSNVAARIQSYERRFSQDRPQSPPGKKKRPTVEYGFVSRPSLFVANPDRRPSGSSSVDSRN